MIVGKSPILWPLIFLGLHGPIQTLAQSPHGPLRGEQMLSSSRACRDQHVADPNLAKCDLRNNGTDDARTATLRAIADHTAASVKRDIAERIARSVRSQFAAATWLSEGNPLQGAGNQVLKQKITEAKNKCANVSPSQMGSLTMNLDSIDEKAELGLNGIPAEQVNRGREFFQKRLIVASVEVNRINRFMTDRPLSREQKQQLEARLQKIRETYPMLAEDSEAFSLRQIIKASHPGIHDQDSTVSHPRIDDILFPDSKGVYAQPQPAIQVTRGNEGLVNQILSKPLNDQARNELKRLLRRSLEKAFTSISAFCALDTCQTLGVSLDTTAKLVSNEDHAGRAVLLRAVCSCNLGAQTDYVSGKNQLLLAGATLGGMVLCPFTLGLGCYGAAAAGTALSVASAANTYGAITDSRRSEPLAAAVLNLPSLSASERARALTENQTNSGRIITGIAETAAGGLPGPGLIRQGRRVYTSPEAFRPLARSTISSDQILRETVKQKDELTKLGVKFEMDANRITTVGGDVRYGFGHVNYNRGTTGDHFGEILRVTELPTPVQNGSLSTPAFRHPEMAKHAEELRKMGYDLVVDTSMRGTNTGAYFWDHTRVIALRPDSNWQTFLHEYQHAQFAHFIRPRFSQYQEAVGTQGRSIREVLPERAIAAYGDREVGRLETLLRQGHTELGVNESLSTARELDRLGWKKYVPFVGTEPRIYGANHRAHSLAELQSQGITLTPVQQKALSSARQEVVIAQVNRWSPLAAVGTAEVIVISRIRSEKPKWEIIQPKNVIYNPSSGEMIAELPDGRLMSYSPFAP